MLLEIFDRQILVESARDDGDEKCDPSCCQPSTWRNLMARFCVQELVHESNGPSKSGTGELDVGLGIIREHSHDLLFMVEIEIVINLLGDSLHFGPFFVRFLVAAAATLAFFARAIRS